MTRAATPVRADETSARFAALYESARDDVYAYTASLLREPAAAEDVTAQAFERAFRKRGTYNPRKGSERAWLFGIARNAALDELRKRKRRAPLEGDVVADEPAPEDVADRALKRADLKRALADLSPREREIVALKFHAGLNNKEIADVLGLSETAAGSLLHRTVQKLRRACHAPA